MVRSADACVTSDEAPLACMTASASMLPVSETAGARLIAPSLYGRGSATPVRIASTRGVRAPRLRRGSEVEVQLEGDPVGIGDEDLVGLHLRHVILHVRDTVLLQARDDLVPTLAEQGDVVDAAAATEAE